MSRYDVALRTPDLGDVIKLEGVSWNDAVDYLDEHAESYAEESYLVILDHQGQFQVDAGEEDFDYVE